MTLQERIELLEKLKDFYEWVEWPAWVKHMPMEAMLDCLGWIENLSEEVLDEVITEFLDDEQNQKVIKKFNFNEEELEYFLWWLWATVGILKWEKLIIDSNIKMMEDYKKLEKELENVKAEEDRIEKEKAIDEIKAEITIRFKK